MAKWAQMLAAAAAKMQRRPAPKRSSTVAPQTTPFSTAASKGERLPRSNVAAPVPRHCWFASLLAKMRRGRASADRKRAPSKSKVAPKQATKNLQSKLSWATSPDEPASASSTLKTEPSSSPTACSGKSKARGCSSSPTACSGKSKAARSSSPTACSGKSKATRSSPPTACSGKSKPGRSSSPTACSGKALERVEGFHHSPVSACPCPGPRPAPPPLRDHGEETRRYRDRFNEYWFKVIALGGTVIAFLYGELKSNIEKEVDNKIKERELKERDRLLSEKQDEINKKDSEIQSLQTKRSWF